MSLERDTKSLLAVNLGLGTNILLAIVKTTVGVLGHSPALLAEGINSTSDVAYYIAASIFGFQRNDAYFKTDPVSRQAPKVDFSNTKK